MKTRPARKPEMPPGARGLLARCEASLRTVDRLNRSSKVKMPLHEAMDFLAVALGQIGPVPEHYPGHD